MEATKNLPDNVKRFTISVQGETTGKNWEGEFEVVCMPSLRQKANASVMEAQLNGDLANVDPATRMYHSMVAQLSQRLSAAPDWWIQSEGGQNLQDLNVIVEVYTQCANAERDWREEVWGKPIEGDIKDTSVEDDEQTDA